jgi:hypothetical protein
MARVERRNPKLRDVPFKEFFADELAELRAASREWSEGSRSLVKEAAERGAIDEELLEGVSELERRFKLRLRLLEGRLENIAAAAAGRNDAETEEAKSKQEGVRYFRRLVDKAHRLVAGWVAEVATGVAADPAEEHCAGPGER